MIGIITAVDSEQNAVLKKMSRVKTSTRYGIQFLEGSIRDTQCVTALAGIGKVNAARCTQLMIDQFSPEKVVNVGSAGGLHPDLTIGDVVISTACIQHDFDLTAFGYKPGALNANDDGFISADPQFGSLCKKAMSRCVDSEYKVLSGPIATGDQFNNSPEKKRQLFQDFGAYCNEMEGGAVAQVCALCRIPFVIVRSISDNSDNDTLDMYNNFKELAAQRCADFLEILMTEMKENN